MYYPCTFCTCAKYKSTAVHHRRRPAFAVLSIPFSDVLPMYLLYLCKIQVNGRTPSTTVCLRRLNYSLFRCTTHVPFVLVQNTSQRFSPLVSSQPSQLWLSLSADRRCPACLPSVIGQASQSHQKPLASGKVRNEIPM